MKEKTLRFESLEPRLLLSADLVGSTFDSEHELVLEDADGTRVTFELRGPGSGAVVADGGSWDLVLINTDAQTSFSVKAQGGDGRVALDDIHVAGALNSIDAPQAHLTGTLAMEGALGAGLLIGSASDALIAMPGLGVSFFGFNLGGLIVLGNLENTEVLIGANLGADGQLGGSGAAADTFGPGSITLLAVLGSVSDSMVRAGQDPVNGVFDDCEDVIAGGADSGIGFVLIGGGVSADSRIIAGRLPAWALVDGQLISAAGDPRFKTDVHGPEVELALANDTGASASDGVTVDPSIAGSVADANGIVSLRAGFGGTADVDISDKLATDGTFLLSRSDLEEIHGGTLDDGSYTLTIEAEDGQGNACPHTIAFTLDSTSPTATVSQAPGQEDPTRGDLIQFTVEFGEAVTGFDAADISFAGSTAGSEFVAAVTGSGTTYTVSVTGMSGSGVVVISVPAAAATDAAGNASLEATISDNSVTFGPNLPPVADEDFFTVPAGQPTLITFAELLDGDEDDDGDELKVVSVDQWVLDALGNRVAEVTGVDFDLGQFVVAPTAGFFVGAGRFNYTITDGFDRFDDGVVTITYVNQPPVAENDSYSVDEDAVLTVATPGVLGNDADVESAVLTVALETGPANGSLVLNANGSFSYTPNLNFNGTDSFTYRASDGSLSDVGEVTITVHAVNDAPVAVEDSYAVDEDGVLSVATPTVLGNDTDVDSAALTVTLETGPAHGTLTLNENGSFTYTPDLNFSGTDSFTYRASDGPLSDLATVSLTVKAVNDAPVAGDDDYSIDEDTALTISTPGVLGNDVDVDSSLEAILVTGPAHGTLTLNANGSFTYTPHLNFNGIDTFTYQAGDGSLSDLGEVTITVNALNDAPVAAEDSYAVDEDGVLSVATPAVLANDTDVESDALTVTLETGPANGSLVLNTDGSFTYTPNADFNGSDSFTYQVSDGERDDVGFVAITINAVNDAPIAADDAYTTDEDTALTLLLPGVLANDTDIDSSLIALVQTGPTHGTLSLNTDGSFTYTPELNFNGSDSFTYRASDGPLSELATVSITVNAVNDAPVARADSYLVVEDTVLTVAMPGVLGNDTDVDSAALTAALATAPAHGSLVLNADGRLTYTPNPDFSGSDSFAYRVNDGDRDAIALVSITVRGVNDAPVPANDVFVNRPGSAATITFADLVRNDTDADGNALSIVGVLGLAVDANGFPVANVITDPVTRTIRVVPRPEFPLFTGEARFLYTVADGFGGFAAAQVTIDYRNAAPVADEDVFTSNHGQQKVISVDDLLVGDTDADGDALRVVHVDGEVSDLLGNVIADVTLLGQVIVVTPRPEFASFIGAARFNYRVADGFGGFGIGQATIDYINEAPLAGDDAFTVLPGASRDIAFWELLADDTDADGDGLAVVWAEGEVRDAAGNIVALVTIDDELQQLRITPTPEFASFSGVATFRYRIADGFGGEDVGEVAINYTDNVPPTTGEHVLEMPAGAGGEITFADLLAGHFDPNGDPLEVVSADTQVLDVIMGNVVATVQFDRDHGRLVVTPTPEFMTFTGTAQFRYRITDPFGPPVEGVVTIIFAEAGAPAFQTALVHEQDPLPTFEAKVSLAEVQPVEHGGFVDPAPSAAEESAAAGDGAWAVVALSPMGWVLQRRLAPAARAGVDWNSSWSSGPLPLAPRPGRGNFAEFSKPPRAR